MPTKRGKKSLKKKRKGSPRSKKVVAAKQLTPVTPKTKFHFSRRTIALMMITVGVNLMLLSGLYLLYRQTILSFKATPQYVVEADLRTAEPSTIEISDVKLKQLVTPAEIVNGVWQTSDQSATHLATSARPGERGNIVIYGHNVSDIFQKLHQVKIGQIITLKTSDGLQHEYKVTVTKRVKPDQIEVVLPTDYEVLTVYTCIGFLDSERWVVQAEPVVQQVL